MYGGWGWGGQFPLIVPELDLIAVFTDGISKKTWITRTL